MLFYYTGILQFSEVTPNALKKILYVDLGMRQISKKSSLEDLITLLDKLPGLLPGESVVAWVVRQALEKQ
jgi:hypothetical protein